MVDDTNTQDGSTNLERNEDGTLTVPVRGSTLDVEFRGVWGELDAIAIEALDDILDRMVTDNLHGLIPDLSSLVEVSFTGEILRQTFERGYGRALGEIYEDESEYDSSSSLVEEDKQKKREDVDDGDAESLPPRGAGGGTKTQRLRSSVRSRFECLAQRISRCRHRTM